MGQRTFKPRHRALNSGHREINLKRDRLQAMYQSVEWRKFSIRFLQENPTCYACGEKSRVTDHIRPHKGDKDLFEKFGNHIPLCTTCHNTVTGKFDYKHSEGDSIEAKANWLKSERLRNEELKMRKFPSVKALEFRT